MTLRAFRLIEWVFVALCLAVALGVTLWELELPLGDDVIRRVLFLWAPWIVVLLVYLAMKIGSLGGRTVVALDDPIEMPTLSTFMVGAATAIYLSQLPYTFGFDPVGRAFTFTLCLVFLALVLLGVFPDKPEQPLRSRFGSWVLQHWKGIWVLCLAIVAATSLLLREPLRILWFPLLANSLAQALFGRGRKSTLPPSAPV